MKKFLFLIIFFFILIINNSYAFEVKHEFKVYIGGFSATKTSYTYRIDDEKFFSDANVKTKGMFNTIYPYEAKYNSYGKRSKDDLVTLSYKYDAKSRFNHRTKELVYDNNGNPLYRLSSKNGEVKKIDLSKVKKVENSVDLQTVFAQLLLQIKEVKFCTSETKVFDGKKSYVVKFSDEGKEYIKKTKDLPYEGEAIKCSMFIDTMGQKREGLLWEISQDKPVNVWVLFDKNGIPFVAKIIVDETDLGALKVYSRKVDIKG